MNGSELKKEYNHKMKALVQQTRKLALEFVFAEIGKGKTARI